ncbi:MAG: hydroxysqualene dehydroxylase [Myxococcota bacterium]
MEPIRTDVLVVGGGLAGLTAAIGLGDLGLDVLVLEREPILGGRARSWPDAATGDPVHIGPHVFLTEYPNMLRLLDELGTRDRVVWQEDRFVTMVDGASQAVIRSDPRLPAPYHFVPSLLRVPGLKKRDVFSNWPVTQFALTMREDDVRRLDLVNAEAFLRSMGVTATFLAWFWRFTSLSFMNLPLEITSAGALMRIYRALIAKNDVRIGFPDGGLGDVFAPAARRAIERAGGRVCTSVVVRRLLHEGRRVTGAQLADGRIVRARHVVAALPPGALREILPRPWVAEAPFDDLAHFHPVPYRCVYLWFDRKITDLAFWARTFRQHDLNTDFYDFSNIYRDWKDRPSMIGSNIIYSHRAEHLSDEEIAQRTLAELAEFLPAAKEARLVRWVVNHVPNVIHCPFPGTERRRPDQRSPIDGLFLAGDWTRTGFPCTMEGATRSGWLAAEAIRGDLGRPRALAVDYGPGEGLVPLFSRALRHVPTWHVGRWVRRLPA